MNGDSCAFIVDGNCNFHIILPAHPTPAQLTAAKLLQEKLEKVYGVHLDIDQIDTPAAQRCIFLGDHPEILSRFPEIDYRRLGDEGFWWLFTTDTIVIAGSKTRGTLYGVISFLETFVGIQFFDPDFTYYPPCENKTLSLPLLSKFELPAFKFRMVTYLNLLDPDFSYLLKVNMNPFAEDDTGGQVGKLSTAHMTHTFIQLVNPKKYFANHPEYFALIKGERVGGPMSQLCLTNPDVIRIATEQVLQWFAEDPTIMSMGVVQNDVDGYCECDACRALEAQYGGVHSAPIINLCNQIGVKLAQVYPDKFIHTIAYTYSLDPPKGMEIRPNVIVVPCDMYPDCCDNKAIGHHERTERYVAIAKEWCRIAPNVLIWHYCVDFVHFLLPFPNFRSLYESTKIYRDLGVKGILFQATTQPGVYGEFEEFRNWFLTKILWNPDLSYEELVTTFLTGYYGKAAPVVQSYLNELYQLAEDPRTCIHLYSGLEEMPTLTQSFLLSHMQSLERAKDLVKESPALGNHLDKILLSLDYAYLIFPVQYKSVLGKIAPIDLVIRKPIYERFLAAVKKFQIGVVSESLPAVTFTERQDMICQEHSLLALAEIAPAVMNILQDLIQLVSNHADSKSNVKINDFITATLRRGFHPLHLSHWLNEKNLVRWTPDADIWTRKLNPPRINSFLTPQLFSIQKSELPGAIELLLDGIPGQVEKID
jgi:hypothetical protein